MTAAVPREPQPERFRCLDCGRFVPSVSVSEITDSQTGEWSGYGTCSTNGRVPLTVTLLTEAPR